MTHMLCGAEVRRFYLNKVQGFRGMEVDSYEIQPALPKDEFSYLVTKSNYEGYEKENRVEFVTTKPQIVEGRAFVSVPLDTPVFRGGDKKLRAIKGLSVAARVQTLRYGGRPFLYKGFLDMNPPCELPLKVIEWEITMKHGDIFFQSSKWDEKPTVIGIPPSLFDVFQHEGKKYPHAPRKPMDFEKFFFQHWLEDKTLTHEMVRGSYEEEVLAPHEEDCKRYEDEVAQQVDYYDNWLREKGVILTEIQEIWKYLQETALPSAARQVEEDAKKILCEAGHDEFLS